MERRVRYCAIWAITASSALAAILALSPSVCAQQASVSAWDAADFRVWGYIPYWANATTIGNFPANGMYQHVSDVLYFGAVRPDADGDLSYGAAAYQTNLATLRSQSAAHGFDLHLSMMAVTGGTVDAVWTSIVNSAAKRANFVNNVKMLMNGAAGTSDDIKGFNFDWERPDTAALWGNYTQLARELGAALNPMGTEGREITVCDYGSTDTKWDDTALFDAKVYDQLFMMSYHLTKAESDTYADQKTNLTGQGDAKAFSDDQIAVGIGTWGRGGPATVTLATFVAAHPNLAPDVLSITGTYNDINNVSRTGTWEIESRYQVREKTQLALDRGMPGMFSWTLHYDATNQLGLHRVMHHYMVFQRNAPDLNLDGRVDAADANKLADQMGSVPGWTGTNTPARFDDFYLSGNWEKGDRDGNGFVNQVDADWLAGRFAALGVNLPDRLAYTGTFESFLDGNGLSGRWQAVRSGLGQLPETGNYTQHAAGFLPFAGAGVGADKHSNRAVTIRNQNASEAFDSLNTQPRTMRVNLATPIDLAAEEDTYFTFLVRQNTAPLLASQLASPNRTLSLEFLDAADQNQFDFSLFGQQEDFAIRSQADATGDDVSADGFAANATYLFVGKIAGNGAAANTLHASLFANGAEVGKFTDPGFEWMLTANSSAGFNPLITQLQFTSLFEANYTVSNVWIGGAQDFFAPTPADLGDFNADGMVDPADYVVWRKGFGPIYSDAHYAAWRAHFGQAIGSAGAVGFANRASVPEPSSLILVIAATALLYCAFPRCCGR